MFNIVELIICSLFLFMLGYILGVIRKGE